MSPAACFTELKPSLDFSGCLAAQLTANKISSADSKPGNDPTNVFLGVRNSGDAPWLELGSCMLKAIQHHSGEVVVGTYSHLLLQIVRVIQVFLSLIMAISLTVRSKPKGDL